LPTYNEEKAVGEVIRSTSTISKNLQGFSVEILVVDGHSQDRTRLIATQMGARVLRQPNVGKGEAVRFGLSRAANHWAVIMLDSDGSYPADEIPRLLAELENGADVVVGSRMLGSIEPGAMPSMHVVGNRILSSLATLLYGKKISDVCSGMWGFRGEAIRKLNLNANHFEIEAELFAQAAKAGLRLSEVAINYRRRIGQPKLRSLRAGLSIAMKLVRKRFIP